MMMPFPIEVTAILLIEDKPAAHIGSKVRQRVLAAGPEASQSLADAFKGQAGWGAFQKAEMNDHHVGIQTALIERAVTDAAKSTVNGVAVSYQTLIAIEKLKLEIKQIHKADKAVRIFIGNAEQET